MKKIIIILLILLSPLFVYASNTITNKMIYQNGKYKLVVQIDNKEISYEDAINNYNYPKLIKKVRYNKIYYFNEGVNISEEEYYNLLVKENNGVIINNDEDYNNFIKNNVLTNNQNKAIFKNKSEEEIKNIITKNTTLLNYFEYFYILNNDSYEINDEVVTFKFNNTLSKEDLNTVNNLIKKIDEQLITSSTLDKVRNIYYFVNKYIKNDSNNNLYETITNKKGNKKLLFEYILENIGIESYIVNGENSKYNIVKIDNAYYIVDFDNDNLLYGKYNSCYNESDFKNTNIIVNAYQYKIEDDTIILDIASLNAYIKENNKDVVEESTTATSVITDTLKDASNNAKNNYEFSTLIAILTIIFIVVVNILRKH